MNRIMLGTAQFGMDYGIRNKRGKIPKDEVSQILNKAIDSGIDTLDTAYAYGESEDVIGKFFKSTGKKLRIISKIQVLKYDEVEKTLDCSLKKLNIRELEGCLIHDFAQYRRDIRIWTELEKMKRDGKVKKIGFSLYHTQELEDIFSEGLEVDIVQLPLNVFDQRFHDYLPQIKKRNIEIHARSAFLQGLVFEMPEKLNTYFSSIKDKLVQLNKISRAAGIPIFALCLNFVLQNEFVDYAVVGIDSIEHLNQVLASSSYGILIDQIKSELAGLRIDDEKIILPVNWKLTKV